jgi:hypothetical protein
LFLFFDQGNDDADYQQNHGHNAQVTARITGPAQIAEISYRDISDDQDHSNPDQYEFRVSHTAAYEKFLVSFGAYIPNVGNYLLI